MNLFKIMGVSLTLTIIIELVCALLIGIRNKKDIINVILVNILTNPLVVSISFLINLRYGLMPKRIAMIFLELFAFASEGFIYNKCLEFKKYNGFLLSFILNFISYFLGIIINCIIW